MQSMVLPIRAPLDSLPVGSEGGEVEGYRFLVGRQLKALRERAGLTTSAMAQALARELDSETISKAQVSRYEHGHQEPRAAILLAAIRIAGLPWPEEAPKDPRRVIERELEDLRRQVEMLTSRVVFPDELPILPPSHREKGQYYTVAQAAPRLRLSRNAVYGRIQRKELRAYAWMGRTVLLAEDVDGAD